MQTVFSSKVKGDISDGMGRIALVAYSYLKQGPLTPAQICGWSSDAQLLNEHGMIKAGKDVSHFVESRAFLSHLHHFLKNTAHTDKGLISRAAYQKEGWMPIEDSRVMTPFGRTADPEDILGYVQLREGSIVPNSYQPMPTYRLLSQTSGLLVLNETLRERFIISALSSNNKL